jgi:hypothetical protein
LYRALTECFQCENGPLDQSRSRSCSQNLDTIKMCPSGALSYTFNNILYRDQARAPCIHVMKDGPLFVVGGPELRGNERPLSPEHYTLCRCGVSKNKPFCDGSHRQAGFKDDEN